MPPASGIDRYVRRQTLSRQVQESAACDLCAFPQSGGLLAELIPANDSAPLRVLYSPVSFRFQLQRAKRICELAGFEARGRS